MTQTAAPLTKIPTKNLQLRRVVAARADSRAKSAGGRRLVLASGTGRASTRGGGEVIELEYGITVYPAREEGGRLRAVWHEDGVRQQCEARSEEKLAAKVEKVTERLAADASKMKRPGADLIAWYLNPDRLPVDERWPRKHAHTQQRLCERFVIPVVGTVICQDITTRLDPHRPPPGRHRAGIWPAGALPRRWTAGHPVRPWLITAPSFGPGLVASSGPAGELCGGAMTTTCSGSAWGRRVISARCCPTEFELAQPRSAEASAGSAQLA